MIQMMMTDKKIIQIMPAPLGLLAVYFDESGDGTEHTTPVICLALTDEGEILMLDTDSTGHIDIASDTGNYKRIAWKE